MIKFFFAFDSVGQWSRDSFLICTNLLGTTTDVNELHEFFRKAIKMQVKSHWYW